MSATYTVSILDSSGGVVAVLDGHRMAALRYERRLNDVSSAQFTLSADDDCADLIEKHTWFEVRRYPDPATEQVEGTFMVVVLDRFMDEADHEWLIVAGVSMEFMLISRVVDPRNDPLAAGGWSTKLDPIDTIMAELVDEQAGTGASAHGTTPSQQIPYLAVVTPSGVGDTVPFRGAWDGLLEQLQGLASGDRMDFYIERTAGSVALSFYAEMVGEDKSKTTHYPGSPFVLFNPTLGNVRQPRLMRDWRDEKTVVYLLAQGAGGNREFYGSMASNVYETAYSYAAMVEDLRATDDATEYIEQATQALAKNRSKVEFTFEVDRAGVDYRDTWDLGDVVTVQWGDFERDLRIIAVQVDLSNGVEAIKPEVRGRYE